ncbi:MAG: FadR family transcriptional regulator [Zoogloeaceae bacterium]|nr:FadR family transcriptional regulator [Zoogloeaceae bacterium]
MTTLSNNAAQMLQQQIIDGRLGSGSMLPGQRALAASMGISRASLREAISMLEALGMVRSQPGKGVIVTSGKARPESELPAGPASVPATEVFEFREVIEPAAAAMAAQRMAPRDASRLWSLHAELEQAIAHGDLVGASEADLAFHLLVSEMSGNQPMQQAALQFRPHLAYSLRLPFADHTRIGETAAEHQRITLAITSGNPEAARAAMLAHLHHSADRAGLRADGQ